MATSETAQRNHEKLFPGHVSTLKVTDPELIEVFDNFAFDETLRHSGLDARTRLMVQLAALIGCQALREYRVMLGAALTAGVTPVEAKEIVYQAVPYAGMGKVFDFLHATNDVLTERGVSLPLDGQSTTTPDTRAEQGRAVQERLVSAGRVETMYAAAAGESARLHQHPGPSHGRCRGGQSSCVPGRSGRPSALKFRGACTPRCPPSLTVRAALTSMGRQLTRARESLLLPVPTGPAFRHPPLTSLRSARTTMSYDIPEA